MLTLEEWRGIEQAVDVLNSSEARIHSALYDLGAPLAGELYAMIPAIDIMFPSGDGDFVFGRIVLKTNGWEFEENDNG